MKHYTSESSHTFIFGQGKHLYLKGLADQVPSLPEDVLTAGFRNTALH
jgi:hypothetical protein